MQPCVYILSSQRYGTLYIGVTSDLVRRVWEHKEGLAEGFTKRYGVKTLVYYELFEDMLCAIEREKQLKKYGRAKKIVLIQSSNPLWEDLYPTL
jgi:putative endonuclease